MGRLQGQPGVLWRTLGHAKATHAECIQAPERAFNEKSILVTRFADKAMKYGRVVSL